MRPIIGITQDIEYKESGESFWAYLDKDYAQAVYRFGGMPLMLPIVAGPKAARDFTAQIDGLLLSGGDDIHPKYYGERLSRKTSLSPDARTEFDMALLKEALAAGKPVLGICLGVQTLNVYFGGTLHQDIPGHREKGKAVRHEAALAKDSRLGQLLKTKRLTVNSYHHQAIKEVGRGLIPTAFSDDGVIEALELPVDFFVAGVQWHPERMQEDRAARRIFKAFIKACR